MHLLRGDHLSRLLFKGMTASGGAEGVGRAVNQAVVIAIVWVFFFNYVFTAVLLATNPELQTIR